MRCLIIDSDLFSRKILEKFISQTPFLQFLGAVQETIEALNFLSTSKVDLIFLDIETQGSSGVQFLNALKEKPCIILTTEKESNTSESFRHEIVDCLLKPINYQQFLKVVLKAKEIVEEKKKSVVISDHIFVKVDSRFVKVSFDSILYIEAQGDYITIFTKEAKYVIYSTMKNIENKLPINLFVRVHRSYIVKISSINDISFNNLLIGKKIIPVGASYKRNLFSKLNIL